MDKAKYVIRYVTSIDGNGATRSFDEPTIIYHERLGYRGMDTNVSGIQSTKLSKAYLFETRGEAEFITQLVYGEVANSKMEDLTDRLQIIETTEKEIFKATLEGK